MKHCSSIDTDDILFKIVSEAVTSGKVVINGGVSHKAKDRTTAKPKTS